jgi:hypothetical protein
MEDTTLTKLIWTKPTLDVTTINQAAYYSLINTDEGGAEHKS